MPPPSNPAAPPIPVDEAGAVLSIDLAVLADNWRALRRLVAPAECSAVVKADAYGLGVARVAPVLRDAGCRCFFVAHLAEGRALRAILAAGDPDPSSAPRILVLNGVPPGTAAVFAAHDLIPVLNSLSQLAEWSALGGSRAAPLPAAIQLDTGMSRFGFPPEDTATLDRALDRSPFVHPVLLMSHLGCADEPEHPANAAQLAAFHAARAALPPMPASLAASFGIALGSSFHLDMVRPGAALYGVAVPALPPGILRPVVRLRGRVAQLRTVPAGAFVGYGARFVASRPTRVATVAVGYADGFLRAAGAPCDGTPPAIVHHPDGGPALPVIGRISMDSLAVDVSALPPDALREGDGLDLIGPHRSLDEAAASAGTIGYELLTALGARYHRHYLPASRVTPPMHDEAAP
ncbi:MAG: alanine racemase [Gluconacetobacter diazotrophicus]|nr:alanine racemase [Gluconacetobacter diazotrophicus]